MSEVCQNCGSHISDRALRVLYPDEDEPEACIRCMVYDRGRFRESQSPGSQRGSVHEPGKGPSDNLAPAYKPPEDS